MSSTTESTLSLKKDISLVLFVRVHIPTSKHADFFSYFTPAFDKVMAEAECRFFTVHKHHPGTPNYDPDIITWVEGWSKDPEWMMNVQLQKEYYEPYRTETAKWYSKPMEYEFWTAQEGMCQFKLPTTS